MTASATPAADEVREIRSLPQRREMADCKPLIEAATKDLFRRNAFRITGLPVDATPRDVGRHADKLKMMIELGHGASAHTSAFPLNPPATADQIREATQRLKDSEQRIIDEFFWFWPEDFGQSQNDPAIQALVRGDSGAALQRWRDDETGMVAQHNLAVFWQLAALEREHKLLSGGPDADHRREIEDCWRSSFKYWERLAGDDRLWDMVAARIRQLDDARLTTGFARRMRASLPLALDKINGELAVDHAEAGRMEMAQLHIRFMRETNQGLDDVEKTSELVLAPAKVRLREQIRRANQLAEESPTTGDLTALNLMEHARPILDLFDLFFDHNEHTQKDLLDDVATAVISCAVAHQKHTANNQIFVMLLQRALPFAITLDVRQRIEKNIGIGKGNLAYKKLEPVYELLSTIEQSTAPPNYKLARIRGEIIPRLSAVVSAEGSSSEVAADLSNSIATVLRGVSIDANNDHSDTDTALEVIELAIALAREHGLQTRVAADRIQLIEIKQGQERNNLKLKIRSDEIEITRKTVRYNATTFDANDIDAVRFGIFIQITNGFRSAYYKIGVLARGGAGEIGLDCKRVFRDEEQAKADFNAIVNALYRQVVPRICAKIAKQVLSGVDYALGRCRLSAAGMYIPSGALFWKEDNLVPWADIRFSTQDGQLHVFSDRNRKLSAGFPLREVWNAVIFEDLIKEVNRLKNKTR